MALNITFQGIKKLTKLTLIFYLINIYFVISEVMYSVRTDIKVVQDNDFFDAFTDYNATEWKVNSIF